MHNTKAHWLKSALRPVPTRGTSRRAGGVAGQSLVEFALALPFLLILLVGLLEIGMLIRSHISIMYAVREGARVGAAAASARREWVADAQILDAVNSNSNQEIGNIYFANIYQGIYDNPLNANGTPTYSDVCHSYGDAIVPYWMPTSSSSCATGGQFIYNYYPGFAARDSFLAGRTVPPGPKIGVTTSAGYCSSNAAIPFETTDLYNHNYQGMCRPSYGPGTAVSSPSSVAICFDSNTESTKPNPACHNKNSTASSAKPGGMTPDVGAPAINGNGGTTYNNVHTWTGGPPNVPGDADGGLRCWTNNCGTNGVAVMGIHIRYVHNWITGFLFVRNADFDDYATMRIQPPDLSRL